MRLLICLSFAILAPILGATLPEMTGGTCSGFFVDKTHLVTCAHCVPNNTTLEVIYGDAKAPAQVTFVDTSLDIAVLTCMLPDTQPLKIGDSDSLQLLDDLYVFGFPLARALGLELSASEGKLNARRNAFGKHWLQLDAVINPGNSGGPIVNRRGQLVGIAVAKLAPITVTEALRLLPERINFAIPSAVLRTRLTEARVPFSIAKTSDAIGDDVFETVRKATVLLIIQPDGHSTISPPPAKPRTSSVSVEVTMTTNPRDRATNAFVTTTPMVYAMFKTIGAKHGDKIRAVLIAEDVGDAAPANTKVLETNIDMDGDTDDGDFNFSKPANGWPVGKYRVDVYLNDQLLATAKFTVKPAAKKKATSGKEEESGD